MSFSIKRIEEFALSPSRRKAVSKLLEECFQDYPTGRTYYKQLPDFRFLALKDQQLIGHLAVDHRLISVGGNKARIFGVVDLCVAASHQKQYVATALLEALEKLAIRHKLDFVLLLTNEHQFYSKQGYTLVENSCRWLVMQNYQSLGVIERRLGPTLMVKQLGTQAWAEGTVDFLGYVF